MRRVIQRIPSTLHRVHATIFEKTRGAKGKKKGCHAARLLAGQGLGWGKKAAMKNLSLSEKGKRKRECQRKKGETADRKGEGPDASKQAALLVIARGGSLLAKKRAASYRRTVAWTIPSVAVQKKETGTLFGFLGLN